MASLGDFIDGEFRISPESNGEWVLVSPADLADEIGKFHFSYPSIDDAVTSARRAFGVWKKSSFDQRAEQLKKLQGALIKHEAEFIQIISREIGKPRWESRTEVVAMANQVDRVLTEGLRFTADFEIPDLMEGTRGTSRYRPRGVMAVIGPFPFPGLLPMGQILPALLMGNSVVFKPSEKAPATGELIARCAQEAGLPAGVFNLIQGGAETGRRLCVHEGIDGILFTGSFESGTRIKQDTLSQHWKLISLQMGGKNPAIVWQDANLEVAVREVLVGAYLTAGQRCTSTSRVLVHSDLFEPFLDALHERAKAFRIGSPESDSFMGPLIDSSAVDRYFKFQGIAAREGAEIMMRGKAFELKKLGHYVTPSICRYDSDLTIDQVKKSSYQQIEIMAPNVAVMKVSELEQAIALANTSQYGLVASIFSASRAVYQKCWEDLQVGLIHWNQSTIGTSSRLPFGGLRKSGNHRPSALMTSLSCADPIASLEVENPRAGAGVSYPGLEAPS